MRPPQPTSVASRARNSLGQVRVCDSVCVKCEEVGCVARSMLCRVCVVSVVECHVNAIVWTCICIIRTFVVAVGQPMYDSMASSLILKLYTLGIK